MCTRCTRIAHTKCANATHTQQKTLCIRRHLHKLQQILIIIIIIYNINITERNKEPNCKNKKGY